MRHVHADVTLIEAHGATFKFRVRGLLGQLELATWIEASLARLPVRALRVSAATGTVRVVGASAQSAAVLTRHLQRTLVAFDPAPRIRLQRGPSLPRDRLRPRAVRSSAPRSSALESTVKSPTLQHDHAEPLRRVLVRVGGSAAGLTDKEAVRRLSRDGPNVIQDITARTDGEILVEQFKSVPVALLGASGALALATRAYPDAAAIAAVLAANSAIGFFSERRAEQTVASLRRLAPRNAIVLREGEERVIPASEVVVGDVLVLKPGEAVAADARVVEAHRLATNEAALTGESAPVRKAPSDEVRRDAPIGQRANMVFMGTVVSGGMGRAVVTAIGERTMLGAIRALAQSAESPHTRMQVALDGMGRRLAIVASGLCLGVFTLGVLRGRPAVPLLRTAVSLGVAAIPEGLPTVATSLLAAAVRSLQQRNVYARRLDAIENLGAVDTICFDKTGTLTENRMRVATVVVGEQRLHVGAAAQGELRNAIPLEWHLVTLLCNEVDIAADGWHGSATEIALIELAVSCGYSIEAIRRRHPRLAIKHRSEHHPYMVTLHANLQQGRFVAVKGRPDEVLRRCVTWHVGGGARKLTAPIRRRMLTHNDALAAQGQRVLGLAYRTQRDERIGETAELVWLGLAGLADTLRPELPAMMARFRAAGIRPLMITGDQLGTAQAVARQIGLDGPESIRDAASLPESADQLADIVEGGAGFARTSPAMKLEIVRALQRRGHVVAMTGDGINDGPALKTADVGVAMGATGTDFAHAMSDLVLKEDHPAAVLPAIAQGRTAYLNVKKSVRYLVATNLSELAVMSLAAVAGLPDPLEPLALLWTNLVTDLWPAIALGLEPEEPDVLERPPVALAEGFLDRDEWRRVGVDAALLSVSALASFGYGLSRYGGGPQASTLAFTTLTTSQLLYALSARSDRRLTDPQLRPNPLLKQAVAVSLAAQAGTLLVPALRSLLRTTPIGAVDALVAIGLAAAPLLARETFKRVGTRSAGAIPIPRVARP